MKIVFVGTRGLPNVQGGVEKHCEELTKHLARLGCDVTVLTRAPYVDCSIASHNSVKLIHLPAIRNKFLEAYCHTFYGIIVARKLNPDILHIQAIGPGFFCLFARILGLKVVLTSHGSNYKHQKWGRFSRSFLKFCEYMGVSYANKVIAISQNIANEIKTQYNREAKVIPNGVEIPQVEAESNTLDEYGLENKKYIIAVGRFVAGKGFEDLIEAFGRASLSSFKLVIAGDADVEDDYSRELKERARRMPNVVLTGFITGKPLKELYSHAGLFVLPSYYEGLPIALLEAMSYGLSCIVSDIPANREVGLAEERYFNPGDIKGLSDKIREFAAKPLSEEEKSRQIALIRENYDWDKIAKETLQVYRDIL
ncbi:MAG: glycosyltransferase family 4 protein [Candidatus Omnitrophota bacterium]